MSQRPLPIPCHSLPPAVRKALGSALCCLLGGTGMPASAVDARDTNPPPLAAGTENDAEAGQSASKSHKQPASKLGTIQVTATLRAEDSARISAPVTVVDSERLHQQAATPIEALRGQAGAFVQQTTPGQSAVFVRGAKGSEVLHLVDGFRLNSTIFRNAPNQYFALVDGQALDRIELLRGPSGSFYGSDAMGGVVHMLSADPLDLDANSHRESLRLRADTG
ncbi:MAG: TonB-dependent receptor plug domain-containing protein, partial [Lysobacterales bacterium]